MTTLQSPKGNGTPAHVGVADIYQHKLLLSILDKIPCDLSNI
jgi:hypothetical protein